ncbi:hypothetical protein [Ornithinimicrobium panacihumi]|uniref:hypothetical protein n=1 Tax=Ornithinimicrobium panacihumi TaxID=2008449 RepID=UPI003F8A51B3
MRGRTFLTLAGASLALLLSACDSEAPVAQDFAHATVAPGDAAERTAPAPGGWVLRQSAGFSIATPPGWMPRPEEQRVRQSVMDVGVPFTGQATPPPRLLVFLERDHVGEIDLREQVLRMQLQSGLPADATLDSSTEVEISGAASAREFDVYYTSAAVERTVTGTPMRATRIRQVELLVETEGLPKFGFRYAAPVSEFDEAAWERMKESIEVRPDEVRGVVNDEGEPVEG